MTRLPSFMRARISWSGRMHMLCLMEYLHLKMDKGGISPAKNRCTNE